jgi:hypothetical protein
MPGVSDLTGWLLRDGTHLRMISVAIGLLAQKCVMEASVI